MSKNKIKYNLKNVYAAVLTKTLSDGVYSYSYATPKAIPGAVSLSLDSEGETNPFYADGIVYFRTTSNNGYSGDLEIALVPEWFRTDILKERLDTNGVLIERSDDIEPVYFALLFEFDGDIKAIRHVMYNCTVSSRPTVGSQTKEDNIEPGTETLSISADPREDGFVKAKTGDTTSDATYANWYTTVYEPDSSIELAKLTALSIADVTLTPAFNADTFAYSGATSEASGVINATGASGTTVAIKVNGNDLTNGTAATWNTGNNNVAITVTKNGCLPGIYAVTVVKAAG